MATNVKNYTDKELLEKVKLTAGFNGIPPTKWLLGVRASTIIPNTFCDKVYLFEGENCLSVTSITTNPGSAGLIDYKKYQTDGIAVMADDNWYYDLWTPGLHKGKMRALVQVGNVNYYRDNDGDKIAEEIGKIHTGVIGLNFHTASYNSDAKTVSSFVAPTVGTWSMGCQVCNVLSSYYKILNLIGAQKRVSYCLIKEF